MKSPTARAGGPLLSARSAARVTSRAQRVIGRRALPVWVISALLVAQLFDYEVLGLDRYVRVLIAITPDRMFILALFGVLLAGIVKGSLRPAAFGPVGWCMLLLGLVCTASWYSVGRDFSSHTFRWLTTLVNLIYLPFGVWLVARNAGYDTLKTRKVLLTITSVGVYLGITAFAEHYQIRQLVWPSYILDPRVGIQFGRVRGPFVSAVAMGEWLIVVFVSGCLLLRGATTAVSQLGLRLLTLIAVAGIYFTSQRSVWLSLVIVLLLVITSRGQFAQWPRLIVAVVALMFVLGIGSRFSIYETTLFSRRQNTVDYRLANYMTALKMGRDNPLFGVGYGNFDRHWRSYFDERSEELTRELTDGNHNTYLGLFAETGFIGLALYVGLWLATLRECLRARRVLRRAADFEANLALAALCLVCVAMFEAFFSDMRFDPTFNTLVFLFAGISASAARDAKAQLLAQPSQAVQAPRTSVSGTPATRAPAVPLPAHNHAFARRRPRSSPLSNTLGRPMAAIPRPPRTSG